MSFTQELLLYIILGIIIYSYFDTPNKIINIKDNTNTNTNTNTKNKDSGLWTNIRYGNTENIYIINFIQNINNKDNEFKKISKNISYNNTTNTLSIKSNDEYIAIALLNISFLYIIKVLDINTIIKNNLVKKSTNDIMTDSNIRNATIKKLIKQINDFNEDNYESEDILTSKEDNVEIKEDMAKNNIINYEYNIDKSAEDVNEIIGDNDIELSVTESENMTTKTIEKNITALDNTSTGMYSFL